jgi:hypothetical protein
MMDNVDSRLQDDAQNWRNGIEKRAGKLAIQLPERDRTAWMRQFAAIATVSAAIISLAVVLYLTRSTRAHDAMQPAHAPSGLSSLSPAPRSSDVTSAPAWTAECLRAFQHVSIRPDFVGLNEVTARTKALREHLTPMIRGREGKCRPLVAALWSDEIILFFVDQDGKIVQAATI